MDIIRGRQEPAETERADGMGTGRRPARRSILGGLAALPVLYTVASATPALARSALDEKAVLAGSTRPGRRVVTSWTRYALPSGSVNAQNDP